MADGMVNAAIMNTVLPDRDGEKGRQLYIETTSDRSEVLETPATSSRYMRYKLAYATTGLAIGLPFSAFNTYAIFQLQIIGYTIGSTPGGTPGAGCPLTATACEVPFGSGYINYVSFFNYINAICYGVSGVLILLLSGFADRLGYQRAQYVVLLVIFGTLCLPMASLKSISKSTFDTFAALYIVFNFVGFTTGVWGKVFIPFLMHKAEETRGNPRHLVANPESVREYTKREKREVAGLSMSIWSSNALSIGQAAVLLITIGVSYASSLYAGLYVGTASGVACILLALTAWHFLPVPSPRFNGQLASSTSNSTRDLLITPFKTFLHLLAGIRRYPEAFKLLLAFTIAIDSILVFGGVTSSLFVLNVSREARLFTAFGIMQPAGALLAGIVCSLCAPLMEKFRFLSLKNILLVCLGVQGFITMWCCIGISDSSSIGFKQAWEFYLWQVVGGFSGAVINFCFNVLFSQLFPRGHEIEYFGFQTVLSCATIWIPQVVNGPIVQATNIVRLPAAVCLATFLISFGIVLWMDDERGIAQIDNESTET